MNHPAIGAGVHKLISKKPYVFSRTYSKGDYHDFVVIGLDLPIGIKELDVSSSFKNGDKLYDAYSETLVEVIKGKVIIDSSCHLVLLEKQ